MWDYYNILFLFFIASIFLVFFSVYSSIRKSYNVWMTKFCFHRNLCCVFLLSSEVTLFFHNVFIKRIRTYFNVFYLTYAFCSLAILITVGLPEEDQSYRLHSTHVTVCVFSCAYNSLPAYNEYSLNTYWNLILPQSPGNWIVLQWNSCWKLEKNNAPRHMQIKNSTQWACNSSVRLLGKT